MTFDFLDITNFLDTQSGRLQRWVITQLDPNHHTEDGTFMGRDGMPIMHEVYDLQPTK